MVTVIRKFLAAVSPPDGPEGPGTDAFQAAATTVEVQSVRGSEHAEGLAQMCAGNRIYARARSDHIHPLSEPGGAVLTKDWPVDHPHHRGIYWAWRRRITAPGNLVRTPFTWAERRARRDKRKPEPPTTRAFQCEGDRPTKPDTAAAGARRPSRG
jgi:hypothetical protein